MVNPVTTSLHLLGDAPAQWVLIIVTTITAGFICWQAWETRRAANAALGSVKTIKRQTALQEASMRQWIVTGDWRQEPRYSDGLLVEIVLHIPIRNETNYPLTLDSVAAELNGTEQITVVRSDIPPRDSHTVSFNIRLEGDDVSKYKSNGFILVVACRVTFIDVFKDTKITTFNRLYLCGPREFEQKGKYTKS